MDNQKLIVEQEKSLTLMLQKLFKNTINKPDIFSVESITKYEREIAIYKVFKNSRFRDFETKNYYSEIDAFIDIILKGDGVKMGVIADAFSFETCFLSESLYSKVNRRVVLEKQAIQILMSLIDRLSKFFGVATSKSLEELAWILYDQSKGLSIEDFIKFFEMCKKMKFVTSYEHISSRGVNAEFLQRWMKEYVERREEAREQWYSGFSKKSDTVTRSDGTCPCLKPVFKKENNEEILEQEENLRRLKTEQERLIQKQSPWSKLLNHIYDEELLFEKEWFQKNEEELSIEAKRRGEELVCKWKKEFQESKPIESLKINEKGEEELTADSFQRATDYNGQEVRIRIPALNVTEYCETLIKVYIKKSISEIKSKTPDKIIREGIHKLRIELELTTTEQLINYFYPNENLQKKNRGTITQFENHLIRQFFDSNKKLYKDYVQSEIENNSCPLSEKKYLLRNARSWVLENCTPEK